MSQKCYNDINMLGQALRGIIELNEYTSNLPNFNFSSLRDRILEIRKENYSEKREELGVFQSYDFGGMNSFIGDREREILEKKLNDYLYENELYISIQISQIKINGIPTQTFEVIVLDNPTSENWQEFAGDSYKELN